MSERIELTEAEREALRFAFVHYHPKHDEGSRAYEVVEAIIAARLESVEPPDPTEYEEGALAYAAEQKVRAEKAEAVLADLHTKVEALAATWEGDSLGGDRYCAGELRDLLGDA
jgi:hypothetical protein